MRPYRDDKAFHDAVLAHFLVVHARLGFHPKARGNLSILLLLVPLLLDGRGLAAELNVPRDYGTITAAIRAANDGDTIRVATRTYSAVTGETFPLRLDKAISLEGDPSHRPHLQGDKKHTPVVIECGGVTLRGFRITNGLGSAGINNMDGGGICVFVGPGETRDVNIAECLIENNTCPSDETYDGCGGGIYCGGTYCTCFAIHIVNCVVGGNSVHGQGGGVFCALLSNVEVKDTVITDNTADDHGGGVFVDVFAWLDMTNTRLMHNNCPGDPQKADWGGKGGGLACESLGVFAATDCLFSGNRARYYGGGIFTRGGLFAGEDLCDGADRFPLVAKSRIERNRADVAGGGAYLASNAVLSFSDTAFYWNDANQVGGDGGAVFVNGGGTGGGTVDFSDGCLLEGNESARHGGGVYLGQGAFSTFDSTRFLGNSSLLDGGALFLEGGANAGLTNCLVAYNNSARRHGGGLCVGPKARLDLVHCSIVGNSAPHECSGLYLDATATADIYDSILWRNAGGSVEANGAAVRIATSLNEDGADPTRGVLCCEPRYVGWAGRDAIYVDASRSAPGEGTRQQPYRDLQLALNGFDFRLAGDSPCLSAASDGGNMGSDTGVSADAGGNATAVLHLLAGPCDIRGRNIIFTRGVQGTSSNTSVIHHAVFGYIEDASLQDLGITGEEIFGGIAVRADAHFIDCSVTGNGALANGGGLYVADGNCVLTDSSVSQNSSTGNGGGVYLCADANLDVSDSIIQKNTAVDGGGLWTDRDTVAIVRDASSISSNTAAEGAGGYVSGILVMTHVDVTANRADRGTAIGGGLYVNATADVNIVDCSILSNYARHPAGGLMCLGETKISSTHFGLNTAEFGGAINIKPPGVLQCGMCTFSKNNASAEGGVIWYTAGTAPSFQQCGFDNNVSQNSGGVGRGTSGAGATFSKCDFVNNKSNRWHGGAFAIESTTTRFLECSFRGNTANVDGGTVYSFAADASSFDHCAVSESSARGNGGAVCLMDSAHPAFSSVQVTDCRATNDGAGIAILGTAKPWFSQVTLRNCPAVLFGGGVYAADSTQSAFEECEFLNNQTTGVSADGGGAFFRGNAKGLFAKCVFQGNIANDDGGGVAADEQASLDVRNTLFIVNQAGNTGGGAYFTSTSSGTFTNCTIVSNTADGDSGGGIYLDAANHVKVDSSIIWQNSPDGIRNQANPVVSYSCVQGETVWPGTGNIAVDPLRDPSTFGLQDGSPCIDSGNPNPGMNDACRPPGKGTLRNDMGVTGGPDNCQRFTSPSLVGWWTFDQALGAEIPDYSGRGQSATLANGATLTPGRSGQVVHLDGGNDYVDLHIGGLISTLTNSTFAGWVNFRNMGGPSQRIFDFGTENTRYMYLTPRLGARGAMRFGITLTGDVDNTIDTEFTLPTDWHHVAVIFNAGTITLYLDGASVGTIDGSPLTPGSLGVTTDNWLGKSRFSTHGYLNADLDDFRIYDKALSSQDLAEAMQGN